MKLYIKHVVFKDIALIIYNYLFNENYNIKITDTIDEDTDELYIILGANNLVSKLPKNYIIYQFEQRHSEWFNKKYISILKKAKFIWDYSIENIKYIQEKYNIKNIDYIPLKYSLANNYYQKKKNIKKDIDILFLGSLNDRRKSILDKLKLKFNVYIGNLNLWDEKRNEILFRSKIVLNINFYENGILELARLSYLLSNRAFIISENGFNKELSKKMSDFMILTNYNNIIDTVNNCLNNYEVYHKKNIVFFNNWKKEEFSIPDKYFKNESKINYNSINHKKKCRKKYRKMTLYYPEKIKKIDYSTIDGGCILKLPKIKDDELPFISIITPTKNRRNLFSIPIFNIQHFFYPKSKIEWVIVDNGKQDLKNMLPKHLNIKYIKLNCNKKYSIGYLRNICIENCSHDYIVYMDDDDYYPRESVLARVKSLIKYPEIECVGCSQIGCFNICNGQSVIGTNGDKFLSEASIAHTKNFWLQRKYSNEDEFGEFKHFLMYRQNKIRTIPYQFIIIAINHNKNTTKMLRYYDNYEEWIKNNNNNKFSFLNFFSQDFVDILRKIKL